MITNRSKLTPLQASGIVFVVYCVALGLLRYTRHEASITLLEEQKNRLIASRTNLQDTLQMHRKTLAMYRSGGFVSKAMKKDDLYSGYRSAAVKKSTQNPIEIHLADASTLYPSFGISMLSFTLSTEIRDEELHETLTLIEGFQPKLLMEHVRIKPKLNSSPPNEIVELFIQGIVLSDFVERDKMP